MTRRIVWISLTVMVLLAAGGWWFFTHFERISVKKARPPGAEAVGNRYLALERFMTRMGRPVTRSGDIRNLDRLAPGGVLVLDRNRRAMMTKERVEALFRWVGNGGYLIVVPERSNMPDPMLASLHIKWDDDDDDTEPCSCKKPAANPLPASAPAGASAPDATPDPDEAAGLEPDAEPALDPDEDAAEGTGDASEMIAASGVSAASGVNAASGVGATADADEDADTDPEDDGEAAAKPDTMEVHIPGISRTLLIDRQYDGLKPGDIAPAWRVARNDKSDWLLHYRYGMGNITYVTDLDYLVSNENIGEYDHAELFYTLLRQYQPNGPVTLLTRLPIPDLFDWLMESAWAASLSAALLIALWLWHVVPRFGSARPDLPRARRELREHLGAVGRYVWRTQGYTRWLEAARASFRERLGIRHPAIAAMGHEDQAEALARMTSRPRQQIFQALAGNAGSTSEFTAMLRTLKNLKHDL